MQNWWVKPCTSTQSTPAWLLSAQPFHCRIQILRNIPRGAAYIRKVPRQNRLKNIWLVESRSGDHSRRDRYRAKPEEGSMHNRAQRRYLQNLAFCIPRVVDAVFNVWRFQGEAQFARVGPPTESVVCAENDWCLHPYGCDALTGPLRALASSVMRPAQSTCLIVAQTKIGILGNSAT
jgi:hypothetical protein